MSKTYEEWLKYYENATKEQVIEDVEHDNLEIERLNSIINNDFSKICREKMIDKLSANEMILLQDKEIARLNNIINELEKSWKDEITRLNNFIQEDSSMIEINNIRKMLIQEREKDLYKLQELKGSDK